MIFMSSDTRDFRRRLSLVPVRSAPVRPAPTYYFDQTADEADGGRPRHYSQLERGHVR